MFTIVASSLAFPNIGSLTVMLTGLFFQDLDLPIFIKSLKEINQMDLLYTIYIK